MKLYHSCTTCYIWGLFTYICRHASPLVIVCVFTFTTTNMSIYIWICVNGKFLFIFAGVHTRVMFCLSFIELKAECPFVSKHCQSLVSTPSAHSVRVRLLVGWAEHCTIIITSHRIHHLSSRLPSCYMWFKLCPPAWPSVLVPLM